MTEAEGKIRNLVLRKDKTWYRFLRQKQIGNYIVDFYCHKLKLWIEIDDTSHDWKWAYDEERTKYLNIVWVEIIRYSNNNINYNLDAVILDLESKIAEKAKYLPI
jgi:very-short-patch-repair endonuclease